MGRMESSRVLGVRFEGFCFPREEAAWYQGGLGKLQVLVVSGVFLVLAKIF